MALVQCAECGGQVSDKAKACPHCGAPAVSQDAASPVAIAATVSGPSTSGPGVGPVEGVQRRPPGRRKEILLLIGAAVVLAAGAVAAVVVAVRAKKDLCASKAECVKYGECATVKDTNGEPELDNQGAPTCRAASTRGCESSQRCRGFGFCSFVPFTDVVGYGRCWVATDKDCAASTSCKMQGYCTAKYGTDCITGDVPAAISEWAVGSVALTGQASCCAK